jgi:hypothetical protein
MTRALWTLCAVACCLGLIALTAGCRKQEVHFIDAEALTIHDKWQPAARDGGGADDGGAADADDADAVDEAADADGGAQAGGDLGPAGDLAYYIGEERFENVVKLIGHLDQLDEEALQNGLVLIQDGADTRPHWEQDITQLCIFAEFQNINFWFRVPAEAATPESEHAYWLVRQTESQQSSPSADTGGGSR